MKLKGKILDFQVQIPFRILQEFKDFEDNKVPAIDYIIDFEVTLIGGRKIYIDTKGDTEEVARIKSKIFMYQNKELPLYFISTLPKYLGNEWIEVTKGKDFRGKLKNKYIKLNGKWTRKSPNWKISDWEEYFEFENFNDLFYRFVKNKTLKKK